MEIWESTVHFASFSLLQPHLQYAASLAAVGAFWKLFLFSVTDTLTYIYLSITTAP